MRARSLKPGFFKNEKLAELPPVGRLLFAGLWCMADREGRLEDRPRRIKAEVLPFDKVSVDRMLESLAEGDDPFLIRYSVGSQRFIQIRNFPKHQQPHYKEAPSGIPQPPDHEDSVVRAFGVKPSQRKRIMDRDGWICVLCGSQERLSIDHITPRSKGGSSDDANLRVLCLRCNTSKGNRQSAAQSSDLSSDQSSNRSSGDVKSSFQGQSPLTPDSGLLTPDSLYPDSRSSPDDPGKKMDENSDGGTLWPTIMEKLRKEIDRKEFKTWFGPTKQLSFHNNVLRVRVPNGTFASWILDAYGERLRTTAAGLGAPGITLAFVET